MRRVGAVSRRRAAGLLFFLVFLQPVGSKPLNNLESNNAAAARGRMVAAMLAAAAEAPSPIAVRPLPLAGYLRSEWKLPSSYARDVVSAAFKAGRMHQVDPVLLLAIAAAESSFQHPAEPQKEFKPHKAFGIMQVIAKWHPEKFSDGKPKPTSLEENFALGAQILKEAMAWANHDLPKALQRYNGWVSEKNDYARKVLRFRDKLSRVLSSVSHEAPASSSKDENMKVN